MLTLMYTGVRIGTICIDPRAVATDYVFELNKDAKIAHIKRFILRELMCGLDFKGVAFKQLAVVIFTAFANPILKFVERSRIRPLWYTLFEQFTRAGTGGVIASNEFESKYMNDFEERIHER